MLTIFKKYVLISVYILLSLQSSLIAQERLANDPPQITCVSVMETGEIKINWNSLDTSVDEFKIYYSTDGVNWVLSGSVDSQNLQLEYIINDPSVNANTQRYYIYISATYGTQVIDSDIYSTMFLVADNSTDGIATLIWNNIGSPQPEGSDSTYSIYYSIYKNGQAGSWYFITDDAANVLYNYIIPNGLCNDTINFRVELGNSFGCTSSSNIAGNWFSEDIYPEVPLFDSVSVYDNKYVILGWEPSISEDVMGTIIYRYESGTFNEIDTVYDNTVSHYIDSSYNTCGQNFQYAIAAMDSCGKPSVGSFDSAQRVILLNSVQYDICSSSNSLSWEGYVNANPLLEKYEILASINNGNYTVVGETDGQSTSFVHDDILFSSNYKYKIRAVFGSFTSTSCFAEVETGSYIVPSSIYLANSSVLTDNTINLTIDLDLLPNSCQWEIFRSEPQGGSTTMIHSFNRNDVSTNVLEYNDLTANGSLGYYTYQVDVYDSCGRSVLNSNEQTTIFLQGNYLSDEEVNLNWSAFTGYDGGVEKYYIYRYTFASYPGEIIDSVDNATFTYIDNISNLDKSITTISYYIAAKEGQGNTFNYLETSNSNIVTQYRESEIFLPNAFRPKGQNRLFMPVTEGFTGNNYLFQIYNRWGQLIFETTDPNTGWDGTMNGAYVQQGTYIYKITFSTVFEKPVVKEGTVTLID